MHSYGDVEMNSSCVYSLLLCSAEQYTGFVVIPQYWFLISSNFLNTVVPSYDDNIINYSFVVMLFDLFLQKLHW